ncbi:MAG: PAS domain S-box protein [Prolixibacteraceae bacterium]
MKRVASKEQAIHLKVNDKYSQRHEYIIMNDPLINNGELFKMPHENPNVSIANDILCESRIIELNELFQMEPFQVNVVATESCTTEKKFEMRYTNLFRNLGAGIVVYAHDTSVISYNQQASVLFELNVHPMLGMDANDPHWQFIREPNIPMSVEEYPVSQIILHKQPIKNFLFGVIRPVSKDIVWLLANGSPFFDAKGVISEIVISYFDITLRKQSEYEMQIKDWAIESATSAIVTSDLKGNINYVNLAFLKLWGYSSSSEVLGKSLDHFWKVNRKVSSVLDLVNAKGKWHGELVAKAKSGEFFDVNVTSSLVMNDFGLPICILSSFLDITHRKQTEKQLKLLSRAIEQSPVSLVITNKEGEIEYTNPKFTEITGYTFDEVRGKNSRILQSGNQSKEFYAALWKTILSGKDWHGEFQNAKKNGDLYWDSAVISPIRNNEGEITSFIALKEDVTERKKMIADLVVAKEMAEKSDRLKSAFLANMSHEIRTPMNGILGFAELLKEPNLSGEEQQEYIRIIEKSGIRMLNIINDIVDISKIEAGLMVIDRKDANINEQIEAIYHIFKSEVEGKGMQLFYKNAWSYNEAMLNMDKVKFSAILTNLVKNSIKYSKTGYIEIGYYVNPESTPASPIFYVRDTGIGISPENRKIIFERFRRGSESSNYNYEGAGLGLSISKAYVEMHGGKIWVESNKGHEDLVKNSEEIGSLGLPAEGQDEVIGSTFYFTIPNSIEPIKKYGDFHSGQVHKPEKQAKPPVSKLKILVAEDDETSELLLSRAVRIFGKEVLKARTGLEAVEVCRHNPDIDLILMDIQMPEMNGYDATKIIREFNSNVIIIAQTAYALTPDREKAIEAGCNDYIAKPIDIQELLMLIKKYFKN